MLTPLQDHVALYVKSVPEIKDHGVLYVKYDPKIGDPKIGDLGMLYVKPDPEIGDPKIGDPKIGDPKIVADIYTDYSHHEKSHYNDTVSTVSTREYPLTSPSWIPPTLQEVQDFWILSRLTNSRADYFYHYYENTGWKTKNGTPVTDWKRLAFRWDSRELSYEHAKVFVGYPTPDPKPVELGQSYESPDTYATEDPKMWDLVTRIQKKQKTRK